MRLGFRLTAGVGLRRSRFSGWAYLGFARVHKAAMVARGSEVGILDRGTRRFAVKVVEKARVGAEFRRSTIELANVAQNDTHASMGGEDHSAKVNLLISEAVQVAYRFAVGGGTKDGKAALLVGRTGRANVQEACAV